MIAARYVELATRAELSTPDAAELFGVHRRTEEKWRAGEARIPQAVALALLWINDGRPAGAPDRVEKLHRLAAAEEKVERSIDGRARDDG